MTLVLLAAALLALPAPRPARVRAVPTRPARTAPAFNVLAALAVAVAAVVLVPAPWGLVLALAGGLAAHRFLPQDFSKGADRHQLAVSRQLPDCVDLLAALLRAGITDTDALTLILDATEGPLNDELRRVAALRRLGATPAQAWRASATEPQLVDLAAAMARHAETGAAVAGVLDRVAADARRDYFTHAQAAARAASVRAVIPLAVCFLPSFVAVGIVPIVASLFSGLTFG